MNKEFITRAIISILLLGGIIALTLFIVNFDADKKEEIKPDLLSSDLVSTDPKISAANFIKANGTMGDLTEINQEYFKTVQEETNSDRRRKAFEKVKDAIVPDSPLLNERIENAILNDNLEFLRFYEVDNLKVSEPSEISPLIINHDVSGPVQYDSVSVYVDFESSQHTFYWPTDADSESIITQMKTTDKFEDVKVTLVKSGELWFIYDVEDSEYLLNSKMSTWQGRGVETGSTDKILVTTYEMN